MQRLIATLLSAAIAAQTALAWGAHGHRTITYLAIDGLPADMPAWLRDAEVRHRIADQSSEPDRWRGWESPYLGHENEPDHYLDLDLLPEFGLTLETVPKLRNEYLRDLIIAKHTHPDRISAYDQSKDRYRSKEWPGFALHAIAEHYAKLQSSFNTLRVIEQINDPARAHQLEQARSNAIYHMGVLSHFVGDIAQPLHTTRHYNGWVGENPRGYKWRDRFHAYVDTGVLETHAITYDTLKPLVRYDRDINARDPWDDTLAYVRASFERMERVYQLETEGRLDGPDGRALIEERLIDATNMLSCMYREAWRAATPTPQQVASYIRYGEEAVKSLPPAPLAPLTGNSPPTQPAATQPAATRPAAG